MRLCRSCDAPIVWALTTTGKRIPLDADPDDLDRPGRFDDGNLRFVGANPAVIEARKGGAQGEFPHRSHYVTCPQSAQWRTRGTGAP